MRVFLAIAQYRRPGHPEGHEHWSLVLTSPGRERVHVFEIVGNTDTYMFQEQRDIRILNASLLRGGCRVGEIDTADIGWLRVELRERVPVTRHDPNWHCQIWVIEALRYLQTRPDIVMIYPDVSYRTICRSMAAERDTWEQGGDHFFERLILRN